MRQLLALGMLAAVLSGCVGPLSLSKLQFNEATVAFPDNYQSEAAYAVERRGGERSLTRVSKPRPLVGATANAPQRWYSCIVGLVSPQPEPERWPYLTDFFDAGRHQGPGAKPFHVVLVFNGSGRPTTRQGFDSPLCRDGAYEAITAEPPLV